MKDKVKDFWPGINKSRILRVVNSVLPKSKAVREFSLVFVSPAQMAELNKKYRGYSGPTNILSFEEGPSNELGAGDVVICPTVVRQEAKKYSFTQKKAIGK